MLCGICQPGWRFQGEHCSLCPPASEVEAYSQAKKGGVVFGFCVLAFFGLVYLFLPLFPEQQDALVAEATSVFVSFRAAVRRRREERQRARQKEHSGKHARHQHALGTARDGPRTNKEVLRRLASASTAEKDVRGQVPHGGNTAAATLVGKHIAEKAKSLGIEQVAFDRSGYRYHGRVKALADAAREGGLKF